MAESLISQLLKKGQEPDPLANIGQGGYGMQMPQNPIMDAANVVGGHLTPEYLKNPNVHGLAPNENWKTPRSQPDNPLPWLATDVLTGGGAKAAAPLMKSMFFGPLAKTANLAKLAKAKDMSSQWARDFLNGKVPVSQRSLEGLETELPEAMEAKGKDIFKETGWLRRPDSMAYPYF